MCLLKGKQDQPCVHDWCRMAARKPQYFALFKSDYIMNKEGVQKFKLFPGKTYKDQYIEPSLLVENPYSKGEPKLRNNFEFFRQSMHTHSDAYGNWPTDRDIFDKSEVEYILIEIKEKRIIPGYAKNVYSDVLDLKEVAIYVGEGGEPCV